MNTKKMLQNGFVKKQVVIVVQHDRNGKEHLVVVDSLEHAKEYTYGADIRLATMYVKED